LEQLSCGGQRRTAPLLVGLDAMKQGIAVCRCALHEA
jgi:hypothetical protein